jgi:hypothetical protein
MVDGEEWKEKVYNRELEDAPENGKESSHSARASGMNEWLDDEATCDVQLCYCIFHVCQTLM